MQLLLSGNNLVKPDRMGMAVSIEARTPFLDWRMMEFAFRSRGATKLSAQGDKKHWFKRAAAPLIGEDLAHRRKQMFTVPVGDWFRHGSYTWLRDTLQGSDLMAQLFEPAVVASMLERHRTGDANFTRELRALAALALWGRRPVSRRPRALFVTYGGGHVGMILPVIRALEHLQPEIDCVLLALTTGHLKARAARPTLGYRDFLHLVDAPAAKAWGERLSEGNTSPDVPVDESVAYLGINYLDLIAQHGEAGAAELYREQGRYGFRPLHFMRRMLEELQPDVVVATNSPRSEQAALEVSKAIGIPSVGMVDLFGLDSDTYVMRDIKPDWTCVISPVVRQRLIARGFPPAGVVVTGNPAFDGLFTEENEATAQEFTTAHRWQGLSPILWSGHIEPAGFSASSTHAGHGLALEVEARLREWIRSRNDLALIVRYHRVNGILFPVNPIRIAFIQPAFA